MTEYEEKSLQLLEWIAEELRNMHSLIATIAFHDLAHDYLDVVEKRAVPHSLENGAGNCISQIAWRGTQACPF